MGFITFCCTFNKYKLANYRYYLSSETVSLFLPLALLDLIILRPLAVAILSRNPCLFLRFLFEG